MDTNYRMKERIKDLRTKRGEAAFSVAREIGATPQRYSRLETGNTVFQPEDIVLLAKHFKVSCDYLLTGIETENKTIVSDLGLENETVEKLKHNIELQKAVNGIAKYNLEEITSFILDFIRMTVVGSSAAWIDSFNVDGIENDALLIDSDSFESAFLLSIQKMIIQKRKSLKEGETGETGKR